MSQSMQELWGSSHLSAGHAAYLETLYEIYLTTPENLSKEWSDFFSNLPSEQSKNGEISHQSVINEFKNNGLDKAKLLLTLKICIPTYQYKTIKKLRNDSAIK